MFEKPFRMLTGLYLFSSDLLSFLYIGLTEAVLAFSEKHELSKSVSMMLVRCLSITSIDSFITLSGIPYGPVVFLGFRCLISIFISSFFASGKPYFLGLEHFFLIWLILGLDGFYNYQL